MRIIFRDSRTNYCLHSFLDFRLNHGAIFFISDWIYSPGQFTLDLAKRLRRDFSVCKSSYHFAHLSTTHGAGFTLSLLMLNVKQGSCNPVNTNFYTLWFDSIGNRTRVYRSSCKRFIYSTTDWSSFMSLVESSRLHAVCWINSYSSEARRQFA